MKKVFKILLILLLSVSLSSCASAKRYVAYTVYPVGYLLQRIGGSRIEAMSIQNDELVQIATIKEDYQEILEDSYYFFHIGDLEPYLDVYSEEIASTGVSDVDLSSLNAIYKFQRYTMVYVDGSEVFVEGPYYNGDVFNDIDTTELDLSLWMDPIGMLSMAKDINATLSSNYVEFSNEFNANFQALESELIALDASYQNLATTMRKNEVTLKIVTMTPSFGSWQKAYGIQVYPVCLSKYGTLPTEAQLEIIKQKIIADDVKYIAYESNMSEEMLELYNELESELGLKRINLSNISSLTNSQTGESKDYMTLMYENLAVLESTVSLIIQEGIETGIEISNEEEEIETEIEVSESAEVEIGEEAEG